MPVIWRAGRDWKRAASGRPITFPNSPQDQRPPRRARREGRNTVSTPMAGSQAQIR